jgi:hypothetical protein
VDGIVFFCGVLTGELEDYFCAARVVGDEARYVVDVPIEDYPATLCRVVFLDCESWLHDELCAYGAC